MDNPKFFIKHLPNIMSISRIIVSIIIIFINPYTLIFYILYLYSGFSDVLDGFLARKLKLTSEIGAKIDSISDIIFIMVCFIKIIPILTLPPIIKIWIIAIAIFKIINYTMSFVYNKNFTLHHTIANKITGILIFSIPFLMNLLIFKYIEILLCCFATFATFQEFYYLRVNNY